MRIGGTGFGRWARAGRAYHVAAALVLAAPIVAALILAAPAFAQTAPQAPGEGVVRIQGKPFDPNAAAPAAVDPFAPGAVIDFREHMRAFVQSISAYARGLNPRFFIVAKDGLGLVAKPDPEDDTQLFPARAYMSAIDAVMETGLLDETVTTPEGKPDPALEAKVKRRQADIATARAQGLAVFDIELPAKDRGVDKLYADAGAKGYVPFAPDAAQMASIPKRPSPTSPFRANPKAIQAAADVRNFLYVANSQPLGGMQDYLQALRGTNYDVLVIDVFHNRQPLTRQDVQSLKFKKLGSPRLVLAQIDIATAAAFDYFWQPGWGEGNPPFLSTPVREDPDRLRTIYWDASWQEIISGSPSSYIYGIVDLGFDGVVLKGVNAWTFYESGGEQ